MTKKNIDTYFTDNFAEIQQIIENNKHKSITKNTCNITTELYLLAVDKAPCFNTKKELKSFIIVSCSNIYRWNNSSYNRQNKSYATDDKVPDNIDEEDNKELINQRRLYALRKYYHNSLPHERIFYDIYVKKGIRSIRKVQKYLGISFRSSQILINDFKQKIKEYEREIEIKEV